MSSTPEHDHSERAIRTARLGTESDSALASSLRRARIDLLPTLYELLRSGSVTETARNLGLTQSAVSQSLRLLRITFDDELLVRLGRTLQPTEFALKLVEPLAQWLESTNAILSPRAVFDPLTEALHIVIATSDYVSLLLAPRLVQTCQVEAPNVIIEFSEGSSAVSVEDLASVDFYITPRVYGDSLGKCVGSAPLWEDEMVCIASAENEANAPKMLGEDISSFREAMYRVHPSIPPKYRKLMQVGLNAGKSVVCMAPDYAVLVSIVEHSDAVAWIPRRLAEEWTTNRKIRILQSTAKDKKLEISAYWSQAAPSKRGHDWFRMLLHKVARDISDR